MSEYLIGYTCEYGSRGTLHTGSIFWNADKMDKEELGKIESFLDKKARTSKSEVISFSKL